MLNLMMDSGIVFKRMLEAIPDLAADVFILFSETGFELHVLNSGHSLAAVLCLLPRYITSYRCDKKLTVLLHHDFICAMSQCLEEDSTITIEADDVCIKFMLGSRSECMLVEYEFRYFKTPKKNPVIPEDELPDKFAAKVKMQSSECARTSQRFETSFGFDISKDKLKDRFDAIVQIPASSFETIMKQLCTIDDIVGIYVGDLGVQFGSAMPMELSEATVWFRKKDGDKQYDKTVLKEKDVSVVFSVTNSNSIAKAFSLPSLPKTVTLYVSEKIPSLIEYEIPEMGYGRFVL